MLGGVIQASEDFHRLIINRATWWTDEYLWESLLFACLEDGREVYNGFCLEAILRLAFHLSKSLLFAPGLPKEQLHMEASLKLRLFLDTKVVT